MKLHLDKDAFGVLINNVHSRTGFRTDVLEKDYYVMLILEELAKKQQEGLPAYFKGGTALYKSLKTTNRFSEDIDLSVDTRNCSRTQNDKRLEQATKRYTTLERITEKGRTNRSEVIAVYGYSPITVIDANDELQRFGKVKVEATSFTISEPVDDLLVTAMLYDYANDDEKRVLEDKYDVKPFSIKTMTLQRIFVDKLFAAEAYVGRSLDPHKAFEAAKHIYDLSILSTHPTIVELIKNEEQLEYLLRIRLQEELERLDGIPNKHPKDFSFFNDIESDESIKTAYTTMQKQYIFKKEDYIEYDKAITTVKRLEKELRRNKVWLKI